MTTTVEAIYEDGVLKLPGKLPCLRMPMSE